MFKFFLMVMTFVLLSTTQACAQNAIILADWEYYPHCGENYFYAMFNATYSINGSVVTLEYPHWLKAVEDENGWSLVPGMPDWTCESPWQNGWQVFEVCGKEYFCVFFYMYEERTHMYLTLYENRVIIETPTLIHCD